MLNKIRKMFKKRDAESVHSNALSSGEISSEFACKCGEQKSWISEAQITFPCPVCKRKYVGIYDRKKLTIKAVEI